MTNEGIMALLHTAKVGLPSRPRLAPWLSIVDLGDERLQFRSAEVVYTLRTRFLIDIFRATEPFLDGTHTIGEVVSRVSSQFEPAAIELLLKVLRGNGLIQDVGPSAALTIDYSQRWDRQLRFFSHFVQDAYAVQAMLRDATIGIIATDIFRDSISLSLDSLGIGTIIDCGSYVDLQSLVRTGNKTFSIPKAVEFLVVAAECPDFGLFEFINTSCLESGLRWMRVAIHGTTGFVGPTIVPGQTACYTCYERHMCSNLPNLTGFKEYRDRVINSEKAAIDEGLLLPFCTLLSAHVALEVGRLVTVFCPPVTIGRFFEMSALGPSVIRHDVLRVPRCPSCGQGVIAIEAWDLLGNDAA